MNLTVAQALAKALQLHKSGNLSIAEQIYRAILIEDPRNSDANHNLGLIVLNSGKPEVALPLFKVAVNENKSFPQYWISYIETLIYLHDFETAAACIEKIGGIGLHQNIVEAMQAKLTTARNAFTLQGLLSQMINYFNSEELLEASRVGKILLIQYPVEAHALNILGAVSFKLGRSDDAYRQFKFAVSIDPTYPEAYNNLAVVLQDINLPAQALNSRLRSLILEPSYFDPYLKVIDSFIATNQFVRAKVLIVAAKILRPKDLELDTRMAITSESLNDYETAIKFCDKVLKIKPTYAELYNTRGNLSYKKQEIEQAQKFLMKGVILRPEIKEIYFTLGRIQRECKEYDQARKNVSKSLTINPSSPLVLNDLGLIFWDFYDLRNAIHNFKKALILDPNYLVSFNNLILAESYSPLGTQSVLRRRKQSLFLSSSEEGKGKAPQIACLLPFGRAGSIFLQSLFEGHPKVATLPGVYFQGWFGEEAWAFFNPSYSDKNWREALTTKIIMHYEPLFDASSKKNVFGTPFGQTTWLAQASGFTHMGPEGNEIFKKDKGKFADRFLGLLREYHRVNKRKVFELIHLAFSDTACFSENNIDKNAPRLLYHIHNPNPDQLNNFSASYPESQYLFIVRHPIQGLESWMLTGLRRFQIDFQEANKKDFTQLGNLERGKLSEGWRKIVDPIHHIFYLLRLPNIDGRFARGVKLEDIKRYPRLILPRIARWLNINDDEALYKATFSGMEYWGPPSVNSGLVRGFDTKPLDLEIGRILGPRDVKIFETLLWIFMKEFKYTTKTYEEFQKDLAEIAPWLDEPFEFETRLFGQFFDEACPISEHPVFQSTHELIKLNWSRLRSGENYMNLFAPLII